ncbi:hypothetical protein ACFTSF_04600, partial [Kribbella sp. NPDC056951]|uniref:hypothetical protein n=1 Tax=Kribbella sp. NPDC056951 TaxID=3345978 RepID=UPI003635F884
MDDLTRLEARLLQCVMDGGVLDLTDGQDNVSEEEMSAWGAERSVRATVIRDILRGKLAVEADPRGIRLRGARVVGHLDTRHVTATVPLSLELCYLASGADLSDARLKPVELSGCRIKGLLLRDTHVAGHLIVAGAAICNTTGPAFYGDGLRVEGDLFLNDGFTATGAGT